MKKRELSNLLRKLRLLTLTDILRYHITKFKSKKINNDFKSKNPTIKLPPDYLIYESFQLNYQKYYSESIETTKWLINHFKKHIELKNKRILDWGCGPGRIIRHLPTLVGNGCEYYGTDYNEKTIKWCSENLLEIHFNKNTLAAKLPYEDNYMDIIYGISIFTHLSEELHYQWLNELVRVLNPNGILFLTTQGDNFKVKLSKSELEKFENNKLVVRGNVKEGQRNYSAFHPKGFMEHFFNNMTILEHIETKPESDKYLPQDIWIIKKTN